MSQTAMALSLGGITFLLSVIWGGPLVRILRMLRIGEQIRIEGYYSNNLENLTHFLNVSELFWGRITEGAPIKELSSSISPQASIRR